MRVAWFTPAGEGRIADYSRGVLTAMIRLCEPALFCDAPPHRFPAGLLVRDVTEGPEAFSDLPSFDAVFYNLGNDLERHGWIYDVARLRPGIVVLHDRTFHRLFLDYYVQQMRRPDLYVTRMAEHYGIEGMRTGHHVLGPWLEPEYAPLDDRDSFRFTLTEEAVRSASGVVVHSRSHGAMVRKIWSGPVYESWLPAQRPTASSVPAEARSAASNGNRTTVMTIGPVDPASHVADVIDVIAGDPDLAGRIRYDIVAPLDAPDSYLRELATRIADDGLEGIVQTLGPLSPAEVDRRARAADVFVNLIDPEVEGCSMSLMYELPFGKPVITYDSGSFGEVPDEAVAKVAIGDVPRLRRTLWELVESPTRRDAIGGAAKRFADAHLARDYARELLRFARERTPVDLDESLNRDASRAVAEQIAHHVGETFASLGATPGSPGVESVIREASGLLWPM